MQTLLSLTLALALAPWVIGLWRAQPGGSAAPAAASVLLCALAFNLTFFWQELWLVLPKAMTPGLQPVLYHNDHDWTGEAATAELLQGTGALATLASGLVALAVLCVVRRPAWRLFVFWMAAQGLFQALSQLAIGSLLPGNDVGRALTYLGVAPPGKLGLLAAAIAGMAAAGALLGGLAPAEAGRAAPDMRGHVFALLATALLATALVVPFRLPRNLIEAALVPLIVNLIIVGWLALGATLARDKARASDQTTGWLAPAIALGLLLAVFQLVLRPGIAV